MADKVHHDAKLAALGSAIADYEAEFGEITPEEIAAQRRADRKGAVVVRGTTASGKNRTRGARKAKSA